MSQKCEFPHLLEQGRSVDLKSFCGLFPAATIMVERALNDPLLEGFQSIMERDHAVEGLAQWPGLDNGGREIIPRQVRSLGEDNGSLDDVFQLADISRPGVSFEKLQGGGGDPF